MRRGDDVANTGPAGAGPVPRGPALIAPPTHANQLRVPAPSSDNGTKP